MKTNINNIVCKVELPKKEVNYVKKTRYFSHCFFRF